MNIIIIGASSGIGKTLAELYLQEGHHVGITGRRKNLLDDIARNWPDRCFVEVFDVTYGENVQHLQKLIALMGGMNIVIYSSGFGTPSDQLDPEMEISTTRTNVNGFVEIASFAFNWFLRQGHGHIAVISSVAAERGGHHTPAYNASKAFVSNYAEGLNLKAAKLKADITVTDIRPGFVNTHMAKGEGQFWVADVNKAAKQIKRAIMHKKRVVYITRRWRLVAWIFKRLPYSIYKRM
jgi:short-subunit dehydrogenase